MLIEPQCYTRRCVHFQGAAGDTEEEQYVLCAAFPHGIPDDIAYGNNLHTTPYPNDHGIQYEQAK